MNKEEQVIVGKKLEEALERAVAKIGLDKESEVCRYIPSPTGGYIHHFTMRKMKTENPKQLLDMIEKYILAVPGGPSLVEPKPRAPRGSRKALGNIPLSKQHFDRLIHMARLMGDKEIVKMLSRRPSDKKSLKRELINSIKEERADQELWNSWVEALSDQGANAFSGESNLQNVAV